MTIGIQNVRMNIGASVLLFWMGMTESSHAGRPVPPQPMPPSPVQVARLLESLPQGGTRDGVPIVSAPSTLTVADQEFVKSALATVTTEAQIGKLVAELGGTEEVRALGNELLVNQTRNAAALREAARAKNFEAEARLSTEQETFISSFRLRTPEALGPAFQDYIHHDRSGSIAVFIQGAKTVKDPDLRTLAEQVLGELRTERPIAAAAIAAAAAKNRPGAEIVEAPQKGDRKALAVSRPASRAKATRGKAGTGAAAKPSNVSEQTSVLTSRAQAVAPAPRPAVVDEAIRATPPASKNQRPSRTARDPNERIRMVPMISADITERQALPPRPVVRREVFRSSEEENDD
jgi:hypothetical protein